MTCPSHTARVAEPRLCGEDLWPPPGSGFDPPPRTPECHTGMCNLGTNTPGLGSLVASTLPSLMPSSSVPGNLAPECGRGCCLRQTAGEAWKNRTRRSQIEL